MAIRTVSFPLAVWALLNDWVIVGLVLAAAATFLPQFAVTLANAIDRRTSGGGSPVSPTHALPPTDSEILHGESTQGGGTTDQDHDAHL
jgi:hypothetical protein